MRYPIEPIYKVIGKLVEAERSKRGLSQEDLAATFDPKLTRAAISNIERGKQRIPVHVLDGIAKGLKIDLRQLLPPREESSSDSSSKNMESQLSEKLAPKAAKAVLAEIQKRERMKSQ